MEAWWTIRWSSALTSSPPIRLRQVDVKAEHFERQVARIEAERDTWEKKFEEAQEKYNASKRELDEVRFGLPSLCPLPSASASFVLAAC